MAIQIRVERGDVREHECDVLVLKYAQARYGADEAVARILVHRGASETNLSPPPGHHRIVASSGAIAATAVMFAGVEHLAAFGYRQIRVFARKALEELSAVDPTLEDIAFTTHGPGYGLDEREAFESLIAGMLDAITSHDVPRQLERIDIVEWDAGRVDRLSAYLSALSVDLAQATGTATASSTTSVDAQERLREVGYSSDAKPHVFVAMPFSDAKSDHYHYGIQGAVHQAGYLCERADLTSYTADALRWIKARISGAAMVIADLSDASPNVSLEVGYAWGRDIPTVLLTDDIGDLKFDVQGQRCLTYTSIRDLEEKLTTELVQLRTRDESLNGP